ncbi:selenocysteine-specific elongation factor SelB [Jonquetella anthropi DSM 22815]|uniref:Selenocysteine-specific elongation factor n=1 Tax=Jonquetella anthropi DSM 22815 TaxID=885272 RepID=H0UJK8_9BACT|nr:selenocysteine-specific translation elongation factor [Jonquetella anthropi]EHM12876.1 selenocysteine-specific elongation factor SelB [Jonquetella anthropi DSM 22815]
MAGREISLVIGTAGHIDHGKTTLVKALTGTDLDRLEEERRRGITIELGFTPLELPSGRVVSLVDVPGHEKLIRQMVAGASGLDAVILVVAADEGVMPQTREHLDILQLLGVSKGLVVLTKCDVVEADIYRMAREDVTELVRGTFLEGAPILPVSSVTGQGIPELKAELDRFVDSTAPRDRSGALFLPVDRVFHVAGFGTVITGTSCRGSVTRGDEVEVLPAGRPSKVRSVQVHGTSVVRAEAGQRTALCLAGIETDQVKRGDVVCSAGVFKATDCLDVGLTLLKTAPEPLAHWQRVRLHLGTSDVLARVSLLSSRELNPGEDAPVQLVLEEPAAASIGQRFVIRFYSPLRTIGGGVVINPYGRKPGNRRVRERMSGELLNLEGSLDRDDRVCRLVSARGKIELNDLMIACQEMKEDLLPQLEELQKSQRLAVVAAGSTVVFSNEEFSRNVEKICSALADYHAKYSHQPGEKPDELINGLFAEPDRRVGRAILDRLVAAGKISSEGGLIRLPSFVPLGDEAFEKSRTAVLDACRAAGYQFLTIEELGGAVSMKAKGLADLLAQLKKGGDAVVLDGTFVTSREMVDQLVEKLSAVQGGVSLADVRELTGSSRKFTVPVMEYLDGQGITRRVGDKRIVLRRSGAR